MELPADIFLALRYLRPKRTFISVITFLSVLGPVLGVALLIIVTAVMSGFDRDIRQRILDMSAHLTIYPPYRYCPEANRSNTFADTAPVLAQLDALGVHSAPILDGPVLLQVRNKVEGKYLKGIDPARESKVTSICRNIRGRFDIHEGEALIGEDLARMLGLGIGDQFLIHSPARLTSQIKWKPDGQIDTKTVDEFYMPEEVTVAGIFSMGVYEIDSGIILIHLDQAADLFGVKWGDASQIHVSVPDPFAMDALVRKVREAFPDCRAVTWQEANRQLFGVLQSEKNLMFFLMTFIVVVAAFGITGTLITVVVQKTREIGILKSIGMGALAVLRVFLLQGLVIGLAGISLGAGLGILVVHYRNEVAALLGKIMGREIFPKELYQLSQIPAQVFWPDVLLIVGLALLICILASLIPALYASQLAPAKALQEEG